MKKPDPEEDIYTLLKLTCRYLGSKNKNKIIWHFTADTQDRTKAQFALLLKFQLCKAMQCDAMRFVSECATFLEIGRIRNLAKAIEK